MYRARFDKLIHRFTVSTKYNKIYGFSNYSESKIYEYNLESIKNYLEISN